jgi:NAD+ synthase (glutamine-hydrolysing)
MKLINVAAAIINTTPLDWNNNARAIRRALTEARARNISLICLPELCVTGYGCEDAFGSAGVRRTARNVLADLLPDTRGMVVSVGIPILFRNALFNTACLIVDGRIAGFVAKQHLAGEGLHYEPRWFKPWAKGVREEVDLDGVAYPLGDISFDIGGVKLGFEICEDAWVAERPGAALSRRGVDLILNPSASHFAFGKLEIRKRFVLEGSRAFGVTYIYSNLLGNEAGRAIYDGGALIASGGSIIARGSRFAFTDMELTPATVDLDATRTAQSRTASFEPDLSPDDRCIRIPFAWPKITQTLPASPTPSWEDSPDLKEEEFTRAEALALFDYARKSKSRGFVVSLSGGADSSAVVSLIATMVRLATDTIGIEGFKRLFSHSPLAAANARSLVNELLTTVYQGTVNSSDSSRAAAATLAAAIGARHHAWDIDQLVESYTGLASAALGRPLSWVTDDLALQNIQARVRAPGVWMIANLKNALLLSTSNRSEAAVGYATMDGDTCGGLSPIAGIDKAFLLQWLRWMHAKGPDGIGPLPALDPVLRQVPSPELRPRSERQTSEGDLMPYEALEAIESAAITGKLTPSEVFQTLRQRFTHEPATLKSWIDRFFRLWCRNQWKRERYAPSFHLDDHNLDPKTWCRFPILSGGFERELAELREDNT